MSLFNFGKKKEEKKAPDCVCSCGCSSSDESEITSDCCCDVKDGICCIKVLGAGCKKCHELYENTKSAAMKSTREVSVEYITDMQIVMNYGVMSMPAVVINEKVVSMGRVLSADEVLKLIEGYKA